MDQLIGSIVGCARGLQARHDKPATCENGSGLCHLAVFAVFNVLQLSEYAHLGSGRSYPLCSLPSSSERTVVRSGTVRALAACRFFADRFRQLLNGEPGGSRAHGLTGIEGD
jgi:hypothetical protein